MEPNSSLETLPKATQEASGCCGRCGEPIREASSRIVVESGPLHSRHPELSLCPHCSRSLERWFDRRGHGSGGHRGMTSMPTRPVWHEGMIESRNPDVYRASGTTMTGEILSPRMVVLTLFFVACLIGFFTMLNALL